MTQPSNTAAIAKGTGRSWEEWRAFLDSIDAKGLTHKEIAERVFATGRASGWWAQSITVAYEQHIGRRVPGQDCAGNFQLSIAKTAAGELDEVFARLCRLMEGRTELSDIPISRGPETSETEKWRYWRCGLEDGGRVSINLYQKSPGKVGLGVGHEKLEAKAQVEHWRDFWKELLKAL